jgi:MarR family transcriptional regulator, lower aerobic nicotinate degradation pathway regulator
MKQVPKSVPGDRRVRAVEITPDGLELFDAAHVAAEPLADEAESLTDLLTTQFTSHAEE